MNFDLGPDELALRDAIRELCTRRYPVDKLRELTDLSDLWRDLGEAGVFSLRLPEPEGAGLGMTEAVIVFEELGRALIPGPLVTSHLAASIDPEAASGAKMYTLIEEDRGPFLMEFPDAAALVASEFGGGINRVRNLQAKPVLSLDPLTPVASVSDVESEGPIGVEEAEFRRLGAALTAAQLSGIASRTVELAVAYAQERQQFDRPIGAFQAVKHLCADMFVRAEVARAAVDAAGVRLDEDDPTAAQAVSTAKLIASEAAIANAKSCIQVHGGMGFTWEVDAHLYLKRAAVLAGQFGGADEHAELMASTL